MLTEKQLEIAARELCRLRGRDPDQKVCHEAEPVPYPLPRVGGK